MLFVVKDMLVVSICRNKGGRAGFVIGSTRVGAVVVVGVSLL